MNSNISKEPTINKVNEDIPEETNSSENKSTIGDLVYTQDLITTELSLDKSIGHIVASLAFGPIRLITKVASNILLLPPELIKQYIKNVLFLATGITFISLIHSIFKGSINMLIITVLNYPIPLFLLYKLEKKDKKEDKKISISINTQPIEDECNKIYKELDEIVKEESL